jgi:glycerophosphoryl diester phosphodiesterase
VGTVNAPAEALELWRAGAQGIISDDPALMLATRSRAG